MDLQILGSHLNFPNRFLSNGFIKNKVKRNVMFDCQSLQCPKRQCPQNNKCIYLLFKKARKTLQSQFEVQECFNFPPGWNLLCKDFNHNRMQLNTSLLCGAPADVDTINLAALDQGEHSATYVRHAINVHKHTGQVCSVSP
ncbi:hypothetical protein JOB18_013249 [Solea senegalensis]|uniref:Uncharacterized protein n=1 Tax=Solea senegalensis TaxID=28829 RepID=A0AAV6RBI3_SOLSE|nr:hypothetical protein JOB18_013249 [Solea senegalensis]